MPAANDLVDAVAAATNVSREAARESLGRLKAAIAETKPERVALTLSVRSLLRDLHNKGVVLAVRNGALGYKPPSSVTPELLKRLRKHQAIIVRLLEDERREALAAHGIDPDGSHASCSTDTEGETEFEAQLVLTREEALAHVAPNLGEQTIGEELDREGKRSGLFRLRDLFKGKRKRKNGKATVEMHKAWQDGLLAQIGKGVFAFDPDARKGNVPQ